MSSTAFCALLVLNSVVAHYKTVHLTAVVGVALQSSADYGGALSEHKKHQFDVQVPISGTFGYAFERQVCGAVIDDSRLVFSDGE